MSRLSGKLVVGLTGGIGSGKTTVSDYLQKLGAYIVDTDIVAREVVSPNSITTQRIAELLGVDCLLADGNLNRRKIKTIIFNNKDTLKSYESIILPAIRAETFRRITCAPKSCTYILLVVPLLFEKGLSAYTDKNISLDVTKNLQISRAMNRDGSDKLIIKKIIEVQLSRDERNSLADYIVDNNYDLAYLQQQLDALNQKLLMTTPNLSQ